MKCDICGDEVNVMFGDVKTRYCPTCDQPQEIQQEIDEIFDNEEEDENENQD